MMFDEEDSTAYTEPYSVREDDNLCDGVKSDVEEFEIWGGPQDIPEEPDTTDTGQGSDPNSAADDEHPPVEDLVEGNDGMTVGSEATDGAVSEVTVSTVVPTNLGPSNQTLPNDAEENKAHTDQTLANNIEENQVLNDQALPNAADENVILGDEALPNATDENVVLDDEGLPNTTDENIVLGDQTVHDTTHENQVISDQVLQNTTVEPDTIDQQNTTDENQIRSDQALSNTIDNNQGGSDSTLQKTDGPNDDRTSVREVANRDIPVVTVTDSKKSVEVLEGGSQTLVSIPPDKEETVAREGEEIRESSQRSLTGNSDKGGNVGEVADSNVGGNEDDKYVGEGREASTYGDDGNIASNDGGDPAPEVRVDSDDPVPELGQDTISPGPETNSGDQNAPQDGTNKENQSITAICEQLNADRDRGRDKRGTWQGCGMKYGSPDVGGSAPFYGNDRDRPYTFGRPDCVGRTGRPGGPRDLGGPNSGRGIASFTDRGDPYSNREAGRGFISACGGPSGAVGGLESPTAKDGRGFNGGRGSFSRGGCGQYSALDGSRDVYQGGMSPFNAHKEVHRQPGDQHGLGRLTGLTGTTQCGLLPCGRGRTYQG